MIFFDFCRPAIDANKRCLIDAHNNVVINLNINDSFISSRNISTSTSAATVTKDSRRRPYENNLYFADTSNKSHSNSFDIDQRNPPFLSYNISTKTITRPGLVIRWITAHSLSKLRTISYTYFFWLFFIVFNFTF